MERQWRRLAAIVVIFAVGALALSAGLTRPLHAQGPQTWQVLVNNVSPEGQNWSFNAFYPDHLRAHPGDTIVFTLAPNPQAFHTVMVVAQGLTPLEMWSGFAGGFAQPNPLRRDELQSTFFSSERIGEATAPPCGRAGAAPCLIAKSDDVDFGTNSGVLVNPPARGGQGNTSFAVTLAPELPLGPYYFMSLVDGPSMSGRIDVVAPSAPVQSADALQAQAQRQYAADLAWFAGQDRINNPREESNPDGTKTWWADAGSGGPNQRLSINEFAPSQMVVVAGDTVVWTNHSPSVVSHTVSGFVTSLNGTLPNMSPFQAVCVDDGGQERLAPPDSFPPDIWNSCIGDEANNFTTFSRPSAPSGAPYMDGGRTSGILLNQEYLDSPSGDGLPFLSSYRVTFPNPGSYAYICAIHPNMTGLVVAIAKPMPR